MYKISVIERAAEMCGYKIEEVKLRNHMVARTSGFIPGQNFKVMWNSIGQCYTTRGKTRLPSFDLPIQTAIQDIEREEFDNVCRS